MSAPWSLDGVRHGTSPAALLLLLLSYAPVGWGRGTVFRGGCQSGIGALADGGWQRTGCDSLGGCESVLIGAQEGRDVAFVCELVLDEGVEEFVVEGLVPGLTDEVLAEVRAALAHDRLKADHGGALGGHRHMLGGGREPDDVGPVVGEHRLVPRDVQLQFRVVLSYPVQDLRHPRAFVVVRGGREVLVKRLVCHGFTLTMPMHICGTRGDGSLALGIASPPDDVQKGPPVVSHGRPPAEISKKSDLSQKHRGCEGLMYQLG